MWQEMERMRRDMDRMFEGAALQRRQPGGYPALNIWTSPDSAHVTAELPGVKAEDIDISVVGETLTLTGSRQPDEYQEGSQQDVRYHRQERGYGKFSRAIQLPFQVDAAKVEASFEKGVLHVSLPRAEADKPRKITVKAAS
jgi:HSP20 family protein